jgi:flagellar motility protein MotE (MotC chaperone)
MTLLKWLRGSLMGAGLLGASAVALAASPAAHKTGLHAQVQEVSAQITAARTQNAALQAQVAQMEQQSVAQQKQLQQRDAEIAALQQKLRAAGVPASAVSTGP